MTDDTIRATATIDAPVAAVFAVLADPTTHAAIDGTGNVVEPVDDKPLTEVGQMFRMAMYHEGHPNKHYEMANRIVVFDNPRAIAWQPGAQPRHIPGRRGSADDPVEFGGWIWRYDLEPVDDDKTDVTLTYDWSGVPPEKRDIDFPPFEVSHLDNSLSHLAALATRR